MDLPFTDKACKKPKKRKELCPITIFVTIWQVYNMWKSTNIYYIKPMKKQLFFLAALLMTVSSVCAQQKAGTFLLHQKLVLQPVTSLVICLLLWIMY